MLSKLAKPFRIEREKLYSADEDSWIVLMKVKQKESMKIAAHHINQAQEERRNRELRGNPISDAAFPPR